MRRTAMDDLIAWKDKEYRKPLILWGARQVGKTWLMREFGKEYFDDLAYISFYNNKRMADVFKDDYDVARIIEELEILLHKEIQPGKTLLVFDEIQSAPKVVESLKYFSEDAPEYAVIAAGSLLGVAIHEGVSFPVGKVDEIRLYPLSFAEFLEAMGEEKLAGYIDDCENPQVNRFADEYRRLLKQYYCVGGMPEAVARFAEHRDYAEVREIQLSIINQYEGDFGKHINPNELPRIRMVWQSLPIQLAKENKKFFFGQVKKGARMRDFEAAIQWLADAGLIYMVNKVTKPAVPLKSYVDMTAFKLFLVDTGLMCAMSELDIESVIMGNDFFTEFKGALTEQYVLQELIAGQKYHPYYFSGEKSTYETDILIQKGLSIVPIEVKAEENLRSKSLKVFCEKYKPADAVRFSLAGYRKQDWMRNIPLWAVKGYQ